LEVIQPWTLAYRGGITEDNIINTEEVGYSLIGCSKISTCIIHYILEGRIPKGNYAKSYQVFSKPPEAGSYEIMQIITHIGAISTIAPPAIYTAALEHCFTMVWDFLMKQLTNNNISHENEMERLRENNEHNREVLKIFATTTEVQSRTHAEQIERLQQYTIDTIAEMAKINKPSAKNLVMPIGGTCDILVNNYSSFQNPMNEELSVDRADADIIRSDQPDSIGDLQDFNCIEVIGLDTLRKSCHLKVEGIGEIRGEISDPLLSSPNNPYTTALDNKTPITLQGKPIIREGEMIKIHIFDCEN